MNYPYLFIAVLCLLFPRTAFAIWGTILLLSWWQRSQH